MTKTDNALQEKLKEVNQVREKIQKMKSLIIREPKLTLTSYQQSSEALVLEGVENKSDKSANEEK